MFYRIDTYARCRNYKDEERDINVESQYAKKKYPVLDKRESKENHPKNIANDLREYVTCGEYKGGHRIRKVKFPLPVWPQKRKTKQSKKMEWREDVLFGMTIFFEEKIINENI